MIKIPSVIEENEYGKTHEFSTLAGRTNLAESIRLILAKQRSQ